MRERERERGGERERKRESPWFYPLNLCSNAFFRGGWGGGLSCDFSEWGSWSAHTVSVITSNTVRTGKHKRLGDNGGIKIPDKSSGHVEFLCELSTAALWVGVSTAGIKGLYGSGCNSTASGSNSKTFQNTRIRGNVGYYTVLYSFKCVFKQALYSFCKESCISCFFLLHYCGNEAIQNKLL